MNELFEMFSEAFRPENQHKLVEFSMKVHGKDVVADLGNDLKFCYVHHLLVTRVIKRNDVLREDPKDETYTLNQFITDAKHYKSLLK
jgi:hypothetical protein